MALITSYFAASVVLVLGILCLMGTSRYSRIGGSAYEWRSFRRVAGNILLIAATYLFIIALVRQYATGL